MSPDNKKKNKYFKCYKNKTIQKREREKIIN